MQCSTKNQRTTTHDLQCFENGNDDFGVEAFWIGDAARVGYFVPLNGPLNGHPPSTTYKYRQGMGDITVFSESFSHCQCHCTNNTIHILGSGGPTYWHGIDRDFVPCILAEHRTYTV